MRFDDVMGQKKRKERKFPPVSVRRGAKAPPPSKDARQEPLSDDWGGGGG